MEIGNYLPCIFLCFTNLHSLANDIILLFPDLPGLNISHSIFQDETIKPHCISIYSTTNSKNSTFFKHHLPKFSVILLLTFVSPNITGFNSNFETSNFAIQTQINDNIAWVVVSPDTLKLWDVYYVKSRPFIREVCSHSSHFIGFKQLAETVIFEKIRRRSNLESAMIKGVTIHNARDPRIIPRPEILLGRKGTPLNPLFMDVVPFVQDCFLDLAELLHFNYHLSKHEDDGDDSHIFLTQRTTYRNSKLGSNGIPDIAVFFRGQTIHRYNIYTLLQPIQKAKYSMFFKKPSLNSIRNAHLHPFKKVAWIVMFSTWILFGVFLFIIGKYYGGGNLFCTHLTSSVWWIISLMSGQHPGSVSKLSRTLKICFLTGALFGMTIQIFYSSCILSSITVLKSPIRTLEDLINYGFGVSTHNRSVPMQGIILDELSRKGVQSPSQFMQLVENPEQISHLLSHRVATLAYSDAFLREAVKQNYSKAWLCETIARVPVTLNDAPFPSSFVLRKNSEFTKLFNYGISILKERGLHYRYFQSFDRFQTGFACEEGESISWDSVDVGDIYIPLGVLGAGIGIAFIGLGYEKLASLISTIANSVI